MAQVDIECKEVEAKKNFFQYLPRRDLPSTNSRTYSTEYKIIDREPGEDGSPRYLLRRKQDAQSTSALLRVSIHDIEDFVPKQEIEHFENVWFAHGNPDFTSFKQLRKAIKTAKITGEYVFQRSPHIQVVVRQQPSRNLQIHDLHSPTSRRLSAAVPDNGIAPLQDFVSSSDTEGHRKHHTLEEYEVARIINHKDVLGNLYFHVVWAGFEDDDATWLTAEELTDASWAIDEYFQAFEAKLAQDEDVNLDPDQTTERTTTSRSRSESLEEEPI